jgi:hypothetical protein
MQIINGAVSSSVTYTYVLQPKDVGKHTIGQASIEVSGQTYRSRPIVLEVVKGSAPQLPQAGAGRQDDVQAQIGDNLFLKASVDRSRVLQGEQVNITYKLYTRVSVSNYTLKKDPTMVGFWAEDVENPKNVDLTTEVVDGKQYRVGIIRRQALFPTRSGTLEISPMELQTTVQVQSRSLDPFDAFFRDPFGRQVNHVVKSEPIKVRVDPLPPGAPADFKGAVGRYTMKAALDKNATRTNEPVSLKITLSGTGNIKLLEGPAVELPGDFEQYPPKVSDNISRQGERITGSKTFEYLMIPRYPGERAIKPISYTYFDTGRREYVTLRSDQFDIRVDAGDAATIPFVARGSREDVRMLSQDIRFIKPSSGSWRRKGQYLYTTTFFVVLAVLPLAGLVGVIAVSRRRQAALLDVRGYRNRKALHVARRGLKQAELLLRAGGTNDGARQLQFYSEVARALWKYLSDKLGIPPANLSIDSATEELARRSVNGGLGGALRGLLETCEMARFAPTSLEAQAMERTYQEARKLIMELERSLRP